jgi:hypothetical protein
MTSFVAGGPLNPVMHKDVIIDRPQLSRILKHIENKDKYIALQGPRQTGKTTLLFQVKARLHGHGYGVAYVTLGGRNQLSQEKFYQMLCKLIWEQLSGEPGKGQPGLIKGTPKRSLTPEYISDEDGFAEYLVWLADNTPEARRLVIILDEVGGVPDSISLVFFSRLREFFTEGRQDSEQTAAHRKVLFIFAGALDLEVLMRGRNSPVRNICDPVTLDDFSPAHVSQLASDLTNFPDGFHKAIADCIYRWSNGHPYLTQRLYELVEENDNCRCDAAASLDKKIDDLVADQIIWGNDVNLAHVIDYLNSPENYGDTVFQVLRNKPRKSVPRVNDLLSIGVFKRSADQFLIIRNKIYEERLNIYFNEKEDGKK